MRALSVLCLMATVRTVAAVDLAHTPDYKKNVFADQSLQRNVQEEPPSKIKVSILSPSTTSSEKTRDDNIAAETSPMPMRHAKHRRRRRCRNRPLCPRTATAPKTSKSNANDDTTIALEPPLSEGNEHTEGIYADYSPTPQTIEDNRHVTPENAATDRVNSADSDGQSSMLQASSEIEDGSSGPAAKDDESKLEDADVYDDRLVSDDNEFEDANSWTNPDSGGDGNAAGSPSTYMRIDDHVAIHESLATLLTRLFQLLRNASAEDSQDLLKELNFVDTTDEDPCQKWLNSKDKLEEAFLGPLVTLPSCPCQYPSSIFYDDKIWDDRQQKHFRWRDASGESQRLDVYKPGASYCIRSLLAQGSGSAAAQHCCYDSRRKLLTRGSGAGTAYFVSPEMSVMLHEKIDILPWRLCKGDFSRFNKVRPPNNENNCEANPDDEEYQRQIDNTKYY